VSRPGKKAQPLDRPLKSALIEPQQALRVYLDALLCEVGFAEDEQSANAELTPVAEDSALEPASSAAVAVVEAAQAPVEEPAPELPTVAEPTPDRAAGTPAVIQPDWGQSEFQCLSFLVAGITLAAPLEKLGGILEVDEVPTELPGYAPWVVGLLPNRGQNVQVIDIARIVLPEGRELPAQGARERLHYIVLLGDGRFGLAVDALSEVLNLSPDEVRWRGEHSKRPWLAGTAVQHMCAVLDVDNLCEQLQRGLRAG